MLTRLSPRFVPKVWGSTRLEPWFPNASEKIGEVWLEATEPLPLLVKFLFTSENLSVQVHPEGKTEMWHILAAEPGAKIAAGFRETIPEERLRASALSGEIEKLLEWHEATPGDTFFIPAGTVHAIGAGLVLCEIQQHSDITYRLFDYGRPRELHLDEGVRVSHRGPHAARQRVRQGVLVSCPFFTTEKIRVDEERRVEAGRMMIVLEGDLKIAGQRSRAGEAWMAGSEAVDLTGQATVLVIT
jgi:mannose-6-phosphate isomerase